MQLCMKTSRLQWMRLTGAVVVSLCAMIFSTAPSSAQYHLCAHRAGPQGPCTCQKSGDASGQFTVVEGSLCRRSNRRSAKPKNTADGSGISTAAGSVQPEKTEPALKSEAGTTAGSTAEVAARAIAKDTTRSTASVLDRIRARGKLLCGVNPALLGFAHKTEAGSWTGLDVDFCRAVATAVLEDPAKVDFIPLDTASRFEALKAGKIDLLSRNTTWTMGRDVGEGLEFPGVIYFDGQSFLTGEDRGLVSAQQLGGLKVCVQSNTTTEKNMAYYFQSHHVTVDTRTFETREALLKAYRSGQCDAYSADRSSLFSDRSGFSDPLKHAILPEVISKEPLGPVVAQGDQEWTEVVRWTLAGLINAEEVGLDRASAGGEAPLQSDPQRLLEGAAMSAEKLRLNKNWLRLVIAAVGNYSEMFESNLGAASPVSMDRGINALWKKGGILYAPPMW